MSNNKATQATTATSATTKAKPANKDAPSAVFGRQKTSQAARAPAPAASAAQAAATAGVSGKSNTAAKKAAQKTRLAEVQARAAASVPRPTAAQQLAQLSRAVKRAADKDIVKAEKRFSPSHYAALHTQKRPVFADNGMLQDDVVVGLTPDNVRPAFHSQTNATGMRVTGVEYIQPLGDEGALSVGDALGTFLFNPLAVGARLPLLAKNYQRWKLNRAKLCYKSGIAPVGTDANGLMLMGAGMDPEQELPADNLEGVVAGQSMAPNAVIESVWRSFCLDLVLNVDKQNELYVSDAGDPRLLYQFKAFVLAATSIADVALGAWMIAYDITLDEPADVGTLAGQGLSGITKIGLDANANGPTDYVLVGFSAAATGLADHQFSSYVGEADMVEADGDPGLTGDLDFYRVDDQGRLIVPPGNYSVAMCRGYGSSLAASTTCTGGLNAQDLLIEGGDATQSFLETTAVSSAIGPMNSGGFGLARFNGATAATYWTDNDAASKGFGVEFSRINLTVTKTAMIQARVYGRTYNNSGLSQMALRFEIVRTGLGDAADADEPGDDALMRPSGVNVIINQRRVDALMLNQVQRALRADPEDRIEYAFSVNAFFKSRKGADALIGLAGPLASGQGATTMLLPALAGIVSWFVQKYGARLGSAATEWAVKKLERKLQH